MKIIEIVQSSRAANQELFGEIPDKKIARIVSIVLADIAKQIAAAEEGRIAITGFGSFKTKQVEREKEGEKIAGKRVLFQFAKPKGEKPAKEKTGKKRNKQQPA